MIDNSSVSFLFQYECGVPILSFTDDFQDDQFVGLGRFLIKLKDVDDVRPHIMKHFSWKSYLDHVGNEREVVCDIFKNTGGII